MNSRAGRISEEVQLLAVELEKVRRASIEERRAVLSSIYQLENAAMQWLAEAEN